MLATVVSLLDKSLIRVGNGEYAPENDSYGLTTLRARHLNIEGAGLQATAARLNRLFGAAGRQGPAHHPRGALDTGELLRKGDVFEYIDDAGEVRTVRSTEVDGYLREIAGADIKAKNIFFLGIGTERKMALGAIGGIADRGPRRQDERATRHRGGILRFQQCRSPICRKCYIHPQVVALYLEGTLPLVRAGDGRSSSGLPREEAAVLRILGKRLLRKSTQPAQDRKGGLAA